MKNTKKVSWILIVAFAISMTALAGIGARAAGSVSVTGVGIFDQNPNKGLHTFNESAKLFQVTFSGNFYDPDEVVGGQKLWVQSELGPYIILNGKTVAQWNEIEFNSVQIHVKVSEALGGQYLEFNFNGHEGLPTEDSDASITFKKDFPVYEGSLSEKSTWEYRAASGAPFTKKVRTSNTIEVTGVGIFDQSPNKGIHTFSDDAKLFQVTFDGNFYDPDEIVGGQKLWVQSELGQYIVLNGKTVAEWNEIEFNSVQIHVKVSEALGGQYLEFNFNGHEGLPKETEDATIIFLKEMPVYEGALSEDFEFSYKAGNTSAWILKKQQAAETSDFAVPAIIAAVILIACSGSVAKKRMRK